MAIDFNHTILSARDNRASARFLAEILGLPAPTHWGPFEMVTTENGANLDYMNVDGEITPQHYAFLVNEPEFDAIFARVCERELPYWADPGRTKPGEVNHHDGGRGVYFEEINGHLLEIHNPALRERRLEPVRAALPAFAFFPRLSYKPLHALTPLEAARVFGRFGGLFHFTRIRSAQWLRRAF